jgi:hypothetical protein
MLIIWTPENHILLGFLLFSSIAGYFFLPFGRKKRKIEYAETKFTTETTSKAFPTTDSGYKVVGIAWFTA